jgi:DNA-binding transcriptional LysR family regulator
MTRIQLAELTAFAAVAEHRSFTKAAAQVGIASPTMSQTIRSLEERLGMRMFNRTTRSVALTEAGDRLLAEVQPILASLDQALESVNLLRDKPVGTLRLAVTRPFATMLLAPLVRPFLAEYPDIRLEVAVDDTHGDIVRAGFDAGIRLGEQVERDMTILRISEDFEMIAVAAPAYLELCGKPVVPRELLAHDCVGYRSPRDGHVFPWVFTKGGEEIEVAVEGPLVVNDPDLLISAVLDGIGVGYLPEPTVASHLAKGTLVRLLEDWRHAMQGVYLFHPSRRQAPMPLQVFLRFVEKWRRRRHTTIPPIDQTAPRANSPESPPRGLRSAEPARGRARFAVAAPTLRRREPAPTTA